VPSRAPDLATILAAFEELAIIPLVLRGDARAQRDVSAPDGAPITVSAPAAADRTTQLLIANADLEAARSVLEPLSWRYSWVRAGLLRLLPMSYYWWDGGPEVELYWGLPAAPLPSAALAALTRSLWRSATRGPDGILRPDPVTLLVHLAVQSCRPGRAHEEDWDKFLDARSLVDDWAGVLAVARSAGVSPAVRRAMAAADAGRQRPGPGPIHDGALDLVSRLALAVQARARPRRLKRLLAGTPSFGDTTIRCRVGDVEVLAGPGVFVPSPDADLFVEEAGERLADRVAPTIVEVGTGCGAIALALARARPDAEIHGTELSRSAVDWAKRNAKRLGLERVTFFCGSLLDALPGGLRGRVDLIIANLPYFPARDYAAIGSVPRDTIQGGGDDGLDLIRALARDAVPFLRPGGGLLLQMFTWQWVAFAVELAALGYRPGSPRISGAFAIGPADLVADGTADGS
jgi:methylase of polypeptide subunit release factors